MNTKIQWYNMVVYSKVLPILWSILENASGPRSDPLPHKHSPLSL